MNRKPTSIFIVLLLLLGGCTSLYQYRSDGTVTGTGGDQQTAVLYWWGEEGRLWYGKKYTQLDSGVTLRICHVGVKPFELSHDRLETLAKANDLRTADIDAQGNLHQVTPPIRLTPQDYCGVILVGNQPATSDQLKVTQQPAIAILCESRKNPDRYPEVNVYHFGNIQREEQDKNNRTAPDPCMLSATPVPAAQ